MRRLFFDTQHPVPLEMRDAEPLRIFYFFQKNLCAAFLRSKRLSRLRNIALDQIVAQHHADRAFVGKILRQP